mgnify:CR=1 FL=1
MTTKERITEEALTLFSENGYQGPSVSAMPHYTSILEANRRFFLPLSI